MSAARKGPSRPGPLTARSLVSRTQDEQVVRADDDDRQRDQRLDESRRRRDDVERRQRQRDAVADRERRHDQREPRQCAAEQQQADQEQDVVGADQDVLDPREHERLDDRPAALHAAGVILGVVRRVEDRLQLQRRVFVDVDERLVNRIVREQRRRGCRCARPGSADRERRAAGSADREPLRSRPR